MNINKKNRWKNMKARCDIIVRGLHYGLAHP